MIDFKFQLQTYMRTYLSKYTFTDLCATRLFFTESTAFPCSPKPALSAAQSSGAELQAPHTAGQP